MLQCWLARRIGKKERKKKTEAGPCWVMDKSCLPCSCCLCACSTQYHFAHPPPPPSSLATFSKLLRFTLGAHNSTSSLGFRCHGNRHSERHPMTAGRGRVGDVASPLSILQGAPDLWPFPNTLPLQSLSLSCSHRHTHKIHKTIKMLT